MPNAVHSDGRGTRLRLRLFGVVVAVLLAALLARLWYLQVLASERYTHLAAGNRVREVVVRVCQVNGVTGVDGATSCRR